MPDSENYEVMEFKHCPFWIQCHKLPLSAMTERIRNILGAKADKVIMVYTNYGRSTVGKWLWVRITIGVLRSLKKGCCPSFADGKRI